MPGDLPRVLSELARDVDVRKQSHQLHWPSWNQESPQPMCELMLLLFIGVLAGEWSLRRMLLIGCPHSKICLSNAEGWDRPAQPF